MITCQIPFSIQYCCLAFSPAFLAAAIYITFSRIVTTFGSENSRVPPRWYPRIFIACDILSLSLQVTGGGVISSANSPLDRVITVGKGIIITGLVSQVVTLLIFILLALDFGICTWRRSRNVGDAAYDSQYTRLRRSFLFRGFVVALSTSTLAIFTRCVYRVAELSDGFDGKVIHNEPGFIVLEGVMIAIAVLVLNPFHPAVCFKEGYEKDITLKLKGMKSKGGKQWSSDSERHVNMRGEPDN